MQEKELLAEQVTRLSEPLSEQADPRQRDGLSLAKKVGGGNVRGVRSVETPTSGCVTPPPPPTPLPQLNELRAQIVDTNLRLTAASAQLLAKQAAASALQQEIKEKEQQVRSDSFAPGWLQTRNTLC